MGNTTSSSSTTKSSSSNFGRNRSSSTPTSFEDTNNNNNNNNNNLKSSSSSNSRFLQVNSSSSSGKSKSSTTSQSTADKKSSKKRNKDNNNNNSTTSINGSNNNSPLDGTSISSNGSGTYLSVPPPSPQSITLPSASLSPPPHIPIHSQSLPAQSFISSSSTPPVITSSPSSPQPIQPPQHQPPVIEAITSSTIIIQITDNEIEFTRKNLVHLEKDNIKGKGGGIGEDGDVKNDLNNLLKLNVSHNLLTGLPKWIGEDCKQLQCINVYDNQIDQLPSNIGQLEHLDKLIISMNALKSSASIPIIKPLQHLSMASNSITTLEENHLNQFNHLKHLLLDRNQIANISTSSTLFPISSLETLGLSHNLIESIHFDLPFTNLLKLNLSYNKLKRIDGHVLECLVHLEELDLSFNEITSFCDDINNDDDDQKTCSLKSLNLESNQLHSLSNILFQNRLRNLITLNIASNRLQSVPSSIGNKLNQLEILYLDNNQLIDLPSFQLLSPASSTPTKLKELYVNNNKLNNATCTQLLSTIPTLEKLSIASNEIDSFNINIIGDGNDSSSSNNNNNNNSKSSSSSSSSLWSIRMIDLSNNQLITIPRNINLFKHLNQLSLSNNNIETLPVELGRMDCLLDLDLTKNNQFLKQIPRQLYKKGTTGFKEYIISLDKKK